MLADVYWDSAYEDLQMETLGIYHLDEAEASYLGTRDCSEDIVNAWLDVWIEFDIVEPHYKRVHQRLHNKARGRLYSRFLSLSNFSCCAMLLKYSG